MVKQEILEQKKFMGQCSLIREGRPFLEIKCVGKTMTRIQQIVSLGTYLWKLHTYFVNNVVIENFASTCIHKN